MYKEQITSIMQDAGIEVFSLIYLTPNGAKVTHNGTAQNILTSLRLGIKGMS